MTVCRALVSIQNNALDIPRNLTVNTFHFSVGSPSTAAPQIVDALTAFYGQIDGILSSNCGPSATIKIYDLADPEPRPPILEDTILLSVASGLAMPNEVAVCMSFRGPNVAGQIAGRRRGRVFIGPLDADALVNNQGDARPSSTTRTTIVSAGEDLATAAVLTDATWVVFSPTTAGSPPWSSGTLDDSSTTITHVFVDDACDTVRSRGLAPTTRTSWTAP